MIVGLTGGIGSGKSIVSEHFAKLSVPIIDADVISREVVEPGKPALAKIAGYFGEDFLNDDGSLNREKLRQKIFEAPEDRVWLEVLLHPIIIEEMERQAKAVMAPYCIVVIPLLNNRKEYGFLDRVLVVDVPESVQVERTMARDNITAKNVDDIMKAQLIRIDRLKFADDIINNEGSIEDLAPAVEALHEQYTSQANASA